MAQKRFPQILGGLLLIPLLWAALPAAARNQVTVPKWQRFELTLTSSVRYADPLQEAEIRALFVSPTGQTNRVYGFWDGGRTWRVRFQPDFPGRWQYYTMCSDTDNSGLNGQSGEFLCTAAINKGRFEQHGPLRVARGGQHLEHGNRTPFLWLGDVAGDAAVHATPAEWRFYLNTRSNQNFNVVQWRLPPPDSVSRTAAYEGHEKIQLNLRFFRQLDAKIAAANQAGLLNAIAPLWEIQTMPEMHLPEDQAIKLFRYVVARWGADYVAWIIAFETDSSGAAAQRWQNIGRAVFQPITHAPVAVVPGDSHWALDAFRLESWVNLLGIQTSQVTTEDSIPWLLNGPISTERFKTPLRPILALNPPGEVAENPEPGQITGDFSRQLLWWNLLLNTPAGVNYRAEDVAGWRKQSPARAAAPAWRSALELPGAQAIAPIAKLFAGLEFWKFQPLAWPQLAAADLSRPETRMVAVATDPLQQILIYSPHPNALSVAPEITAVLTRAEWLAPRSGARQPAVLDKNDASFHPPGPGDWLLWLEGKPR